MNKDLCRIAFENYILDNYDPRYLDRSLYNCETYENDEIHAAWRAWIACWLFMSDIFKNKE